MLKALTVDRLLNPASEFRLHRQWYEQTALTNLLGENFGLAQMDTPYRCLNLLVEHRDELFAHLLQRSGALFQAQFKVLLYDLKSTYEARESVSLKVPEQDEELYVYVDSKDRVEKERSMRRKKQKRL